MTEHDRPAPYRVAERTEWIVSEEPDPDRPGDPGKGFAVLVRTSLTNAEREVLRERNNAIENEYTVQWEATPPEERDLADSPWMRQKALMAPYILDWNAVGQDGKTGEWRPIPPPKIAGPDAFEALTFAESLWCFAVVVAGYVALGKAGEWRGKLLRTGNGSEATSAAADPAPAESSSPPPARRKS